MSLTSPGTVKLLLAQSTHLPTAGCSSCRLPATRPLPEAVVTLRSARAADTMPFRSRKAADTMLVREWWHPSKAGIHALAWSDRLCFKKAAGSFAGQQGTNHVAQYYQPPCPSDMVHSGKELQGTRAASCC